MPDEKEKPDPILELATVEDEELRGKAPDDVDVNAEAPEDKEARERDEQGKFKGKEEKKPEKEEKVEKEEKKHDTVPLAKFLEEKNKLKTELEQRDITIKEFQKKLLELESKLPKPAEEPEPDFVEDPRGYVDKKVADALKLVEQANTTAKESGKKAEEAANAAAEHAQMQRFIQDLQATEQNFVQQTPDYYDALAHLRNVRTFQLKTFEPNITDEQIMEVIRREELGLATQLARMGKNPSQTAYEIAKQHGYQPKAKEQKAPVIQQGQRNQLPPDQVLNGGGASDIVDDDTPQPDAVDQALATLFKRKAS